MIVARLQKIDSFLDFISSKITYQIIRAENATQAEAQFKKKKQNPQYTYRRMDMDLVALKGMLKEIELGKDSIESLLDRKRKELINKIELFEELGTEKFSQKSQKLYPLPNERLVKLSFYILNNLKRSKKSERIERKQAIRLLRKAFKQLDFKWKIKNSDILTSANVNQYDQILEVKKRERFSHDYVKRLIVHEIGTHALRTENGRLQPLAIFRHGLAGYLETEEGLAAYHEYKAGLMTHSILRNYAGRVIAIHYAQQYGFLAVYKKMLKYFKPKMALKLTVRVKRGLSDTSKPGGFTKDAVYLRGFIKLLKFAKKNPVEELYCAKIGITDLKHITSIPEMKKNKYSPEIFFSDSAYQTERAITDEEIEQILAHY